MSGLAHVPERRAFPRRRIAVPALIEYGRGEYFPCQVIDLAPNSARIESKDLVLPDRFVLLLKFGHTVRRDCRVVWRSGHVAGLHFRVWPVDRV
jgi:hypothetical protein